MPARAPASAPGVAALHTVADGTQLGAVPYAIEAERASALTNDARTVMMRVGDTVNCRLEVTGVGTLAVVGADGAPLSSNNVCLVRVSDSRVATFDAPVTVTFGTSSDTDGNLFGISDADWTAPMPHFLGVVDDGTASYFVISRVPLGVTASAATGLCQKGDADCDDQGDAMILATGLALAAWTSKPLMQVGWYQATYASSGSAWAFTTTGRTGFNSEYAKIAWSFPVGQNGAARGSWLVATSGTPPTASGGSYVYWINADGEVTIYRNGTFTAPGSDPAASVRMALPYRRAYATSYHSIDALFRLRGFCDPGFVESDLWFHSSDPPYLAVHCPAGVYSVTSGSFAATAEPILQISGYTYRAL